MEERYNTEKLIAEVKLRPALWDLASPKYTDKNHRTKCWEEIANAFASEDMRARDKEELEVVLQRKWKKIRDRFSKTIMSGKLGKRGHRYVHASKLQFLKDSLNQNKAYTMELYDETETVSTSHASPGSQMERRESTSFEEDNREGRAKMNFSRDDETRHEATFINHLKPKFDVEQLIAEVEKRPGIWDMTIPEYIDQIHRIKCWQEITNVFASVDMSTKEKEELGKSLHKKWKNIRDRFSRYVARGKRGAAYIFASNLQFLYKSITPKKTKSDPLELYDDVETVSTSYANPRSQKRKRAAFEDTFRSAKRQERNISQDDDNDDVHDVDNEVANDVDDDGVEIDSQVSQDTFISTLKKQDRRQNINISQDDDNRQFLLSLLPSLASLEGVYNANCRIAVMQSIMSYQMQQQEEQTPQRHRRPSQRVPQHIKCTYHEENRRVDAYLAVELIYRDATCKELSVQSFAKLKEQVRQCFFEKHKLPCNELIYYWIDDDNDEIEIVNHSDYEIFILKRAQHRHMHVTPVKEQQEEPPGVDFKLSFQ